MDHYPKSTYSEQEVKDIIRRALKLQDLPENTPQPEQQGLSLDELAEFGNKLGLHFKYIDMAVKAYDYDQVTRYTNITNTHIYEDRIVETSANKDKIWQSVISELKFRMSGTPTVESKTGVSKKWVLTDRTGRETTVSLEKDDKEIHLKLSRRIGKASASTESLIAGFGLSLVFFGYIFLFSSLSFLAGLILAFAVWALFYVLFKKINIKRRKGRQKDFRKLAEQVVEHIPRS